METWLDAYEQVVILLTILHLLKYPLSVMHFNYDKKFGIGMPNFGGLAAHKIERIDAMIPSGYLQEIELIAAKDPKTLEVLAQIESMPDMTKAQVNDQIIASYKFSIEHGEGFIEWEQGQYKLYRDLIKVEMEEETKNNIEMLRVWAAEKGFMESKAKRFGWNI